MENEHLPGETLPAEKVDALDEKSGTQPLAGSQNGGSLEGTFKDKVNEVLGKDFKDDETALKAIKDTFAHVGKQRESIEKELMTKIGGEAPVNSSNFVTKQDLDDVQFLADNPEFKPYESVLKQLRSSGEPLREVIKRDEVKDLVNKAVSFEKSESSKSILKTNPRLGMMTDKVGEANKALSAAKQAAAQGDVTGSIRTYEQGKENMMGAVLDAYEK